jgi:hypothetical protein
MIHLFIIFLTNSREGKDQVKKLENLNMFNVEEIRL